MKFYKTLTVFVLLMSLFSINCAQELSKKETYGNILLAKVDEAEKRIWQERACMSQKLRALNRVSELLDNRIGREEVQDSMIAGLKVTGWTLNWVENNIELLTGVALFIASTMTCRK